MSISIENGRKSQKKTCAKPALAKRAYAEYTKHIGMSSKLFLFINHIHSKTNNHFGEFHLTNNSDNQFLFPVASCARVLSIKQ